MPSNPQPRQRQFLRIPLGTTAVFLWGKRAAKKKRGKGVTRDISAGGLYLDTDTPPPVGSHVKLEFLLPKVRGVIENLRMKVTGRVVRVQPPQREEESGSGFAAITDRFILQEPNHSKAPREPKKSKRRSA